MVLGQRLTGRISLTILALLARSEPPLQRQVSPLDRLLHHCHVVVHRRGVVPDAPGPGPHHHPSHVHEGLTPVTAAPRCHYADQPTARPDCRLTATARVGGIPLRPSCRGLRSTLGKGEPVRPLPNRGGLDPVDALDWIAQSRHRRPRRRAHPGRRGAPRPPTRPLLDRHRAVPEHHAPSRTADRNSSLLHR